MAGEQYKAENSDWMGGLPDFCHEVPINLLAIPGSHDSGTYSMDSSDGLAPDASKTIRTLVTISGCAGRSVVHNWSVTQTHNFTEQLNMGIRYFDLRVATKKSEPDDFYIVHSLYGAGVEDALSQIADFLNSHPKEIVLIDFNHFYEMSAAAQNSLIVKIRAALGEKMCTRGRTRDLTLKAMWEGGHQAIVFFNSDLAEENMDLWSSEICPSPWGNNQSATVQLQFLEENYKATRDESVFFVWQGVLTPTGATIAGRLFSKLKTTLAKEIAQPFVDWVRGKRSGPQGVNICIADFVENADYIDAVIELNRRTVSVNSGDQ